MLQFLDWLYYSDEGLEFAKCGVEGTTFTKDGDDPRARAPTSTGSGVNPAGTKNLKPTSASATACGRWPTARRTT